ncbi:hypothetical protein EUGRSUZ_C02079 [Eucalyptus grandis]|uniref:Uncharacterized protein n=2 Tax=Eucalyptus grandis TaxID=71139 RepID=A0ACC3LFT9_EUCGR|nr:hypothetical protein EUGRSUZ_C02079 [Eucalyptus grandis]
MLSGRPRIREYPSLKTLNLKSSSISLGISPAKLRHLEACSSSRLFNFHIAQGSSRTKVKSILSTLKRYNLLTVLGNSTIPVLDKSSSINEAKLPKDVGNFNIDLQ